MNNKLNRARRNVAHHYDLSDTLYDLFLDADRQYSCAYFTGADQTIEQAQANKKRHIAAKLLDLAVNMGRRPAILLLQRAVANNGLSCVNDGEMGPETVRAINNSNAARVLATFKEYAAARYEMIALAHPEDRPYLNGWLKRANS